MVSIIRMTDAPSRGMFSGDNFVNFNPEEPSMTFRTRTSRAALALVLLIAATACGGSEDENSNEQVVEETSANSAVAQGDAAAAPLTVADIEAYERGMQKEKQILEELVRKAENTRDDQQQLELMMQAMEDQTMDDGAQAAGISLERYKELRNRLDQVLGSSSLSIMGSALRQQAKLSDAQIDTMAAQGTPPERIEEMRKSIRQMQEQYDTQEKAALEQLAPDARAVFTQRALRLDSLRMTTAGLRLKVAS